MKKTNWLRHLSTSFRCLLLVALCGSASVVLAQQSDDDNQDPGNQECDSTSAEKAIGPVSGSGTSTFFSNDADKWFAENDAEKELHKKIGDASGIVCKLCENGRRCTRSTILTSGSLVSNFTEILPGPGTHDGGWKVDLTWTGKYKINCRKC